MQCLPTQHDHMVCMVCVASWLPRSVKVDFNGCYTGLGVEAIVCVCVCVFQACLDLNFKVN